MATDDSESHRRRLRALIAERLTQGVLPRFRSQRTFGGRGDGARCGCCDEPIRPEEVQYDVDQRDDADPIGGIARTIPMHLHCYRLWIEESEAPKRP